MLSVKLIAPGTLKEPYLRDAYGEYKKRLSALCAFEETILKEVPLPQSPSDAQIAASLEKEAKAILESIPPRFFKVALCVEGERLSSESLAEKIESVGRNYPGICFIIGSSYGLAPSVKKACDMQLSVSDFTFPHQLMRVILAEIIYRSLNIIKGTRYHK